MILLLLACAAIPPDCGPMCEVLTSRKGECLAVDGLDWSAAGYSDADDFRAACETWAWESRELEQDAGCRGATDAICVERDAVLRGSDFSCQQLSEMDWNSSPHSWDTCDG